jgi:enoyl-CoA hydratase
MPILTVNNPHGILVVTISRPDALNALNVEILDRLREVMQEVYRNNETSGIIITGDGDKAFVAGADIKEIAALNEEKALELAQKGQNLFKQIEQCPKPVIAAVNGFALGGGCELAMACHFRIATENARFGQPEVNLGIIPGYGGTQRLTQLIGKGKALELMLTGDMITAQEAKTLGLVNHLVADKNELVNLSLKIMEKIVSKGAFALESIIKSVHAGFGVEDSGYAAEAKNFALCTNTEDFREGTMAFLEKRKPNFKGK